MSKRAWILLVAIMLIACTQSKLIDDFWKTTSLIGPHTVAIGNHTLWKALTCCADNDTNRPSNETVLRNYVNETWCKGNLTCMSFIPKGDISFAYYTQSQLLSNGSLIPPTNYYFWLWIMKNSIGTSSPKYYSCGQDYFPRFDWWYLCQAFMPSETNSWFYGIRWYCGSNNPYSGCLAQYKLPVGNMGLFNMTGVPVAIGNYYVPCCNVYYSGSVLRL